MMNGEKILEMLDNVSYEDLVKKFTKSQLKEMYKTLFNGLNVSSRYKKEEIAIRIFNYWSDNRRTKDLFKNLY